jgi:hypothetical protein
MKVKLVIVLCLLSLVFLSSCEKNTPPLEKIGRIEMYTETIYYIDGTGTNFISSLEFLRRTHPELRLVGVTGDGTGLYGSDTGYYVIFEKNK